MGIGEEQFRVEELNPFMEWHLHTTEASLEVASKSAKRNLAIIALFNTDQWHARIYQANPRKNRHPDKNGISVDKG